MSQINYLNLIMLIFLSDNLSFCKSDRIFEEKFSPLFSGSNPESSACDLVQNFFANNSISNGTCIRYKSIDSNDTFKYSMYCLGKVDTFKNFTYKPRFERIETLIICQYSWGDGKEFDLNSLKYFTKLKDLIIEKSIFRYFTFKFPKLEHLKYINISKTQLTLIKGDVFINLPSIQTIDLSFNRIHFVEKLIFSSHIHPTHSHSDAERPVKVFLQGNMFNCTKQLKWMALKDLKFDVNDKNLIQCVDPKYKGRPLLTVMNYKLILHKFCHEEPELRNCSCHISYIRPNFSTNEYQPMYSVNCSYAGLQRFPKKLPINTTTLFITHNNITSLQGLCEEHYKEVHDVYADYNKIRDVEILENCVWFENFRVLSLRGNYLEKIPVYAIRNNLDKNLHALKIYLSENPWHCSCKFGPRLLSLSLKYETIVDKDKIFCLNEKNDAEIYGNRLLDMTRNDLCQIDVKYDPFEILSIFFGVLIILLFANLLYDYYNYKTYGKLPWIAIKTPLL